MAPEIRSHFVGADSTFIWFRNIEKMLLQMTSGFLQLESTIVIYLTSSCVNWPSFLA
jgi:hypothetical protein